MESMFHGANVFNQELEKWDVSRVTSMKEMFYGAQVFNQPLSSWNTASYNLSKHVRQYSVRSTFVCGTCPLPQV